MNVASLENCQRLYELSGWKERTTFYWQYTKPAGNWFIVPQTHIGELEHIPAYDLGFLLEKLRENSTIKEFGFEMYVDGTDIHSKVRHEVRFRCSDKFWVSADNPTDAACLLAIKLFEERILS